MTQSIQQTNNANPFGVKDANPFTPEFFYKKSDGRYYWKLYDNLYMDIHDHKFIWNKDGKEYNMTIQDFIDME